MPKCSRRKQKYQACKHIRNRYKHCGGAHPDTQEDNEGCYEDTATTDSWGTTETPPALPGYCDKFCQATLRGWYCHECPDMPHVQGTEDENGDLVHRTLTDETHKFCPAHCRPAEVWFREYMMLMPSENTKDLFV
jgi:hypothetical protein